MKKLTKYSLLLMSFLFIACSGDDNNIPDPGPDPDPKPDPEIPVEPPHECLVGSLFGFDKSVRTADIKDTENTTFYNLSLFTPPNTEDEWWDNLVEEFAYSGMDYAMANCRGILPDPKKYTDHGDPTRLPSLIEAMERRGVADKFKVAIFDDCPASWAAARNLDLYDKYASLIESGKYDYPLDNLDGEGGVYKYIWDYNLKIAFQKVPDKYLLKYDGRPVIFFWSVNNFLNPAGQDNYSGKLSVILKRIRADFKKEFGADPFLVVDRSFYDRDRTVYYPVVDGINDWFTMNQPYSARTHNDLTVGVAVPGFSTNDKQGNKMFLDADHGKLLDKALSSLIKQKSQIILIEGFTDVRENAALWRSTDTKFYDYPNQRINMVRRYTKNAYPANLKVEAEGCDYYKDNTAGNSGNLFRKGDLDVKKCTDTYGGWCVTHTSDGEWLQWKELPFRAKASTFKLRYASAAAAKVCFNVGGKDCAEIQLPSTNNEWKTVDAGTVTFDAKGEYDVTLKIVSGNIDINYFNIVAAE
ncbi:DUF5010 domain-containing protein [Bacteroides sp. 51]|uniref:DUF5010 domain-containing protein n=1 Tax=Bacteroides sp. 51 TaxID=2302938 RepID=UPI0013D1FF4A|nr:DUF5010 domain-containing protein [Bacteroides sp. 51]NDV81773.1 DUF5010 domain-containing protein [Bacteroides sp. 51]